MSTLKIHTINAAGLACIERELRARDKSFSGNRYIDRETLSIFAVEAEMQLDQGDSQASIELSQFNTVSGHTEQIRLDASEHFTVEERQEPYFCRCCGEESETGEDCCSDDFPEPGEMRETG